MVDCLDQVVVEALLELIRTDAGLVVCCIEALGNFNVVNEQTAAVVACVLERLDSSPLADLPAIVKYLVQEAPVIDMDSIVDQLREKLSSTLAFEDSTASATSGTFRNEEALILGSIVQGFYFRDELLKVFLAKIQASGPGTAQPLRLLDCWVLIGAHSIPQHQKKIGKVVKKKVHAGVLTPELMVQSVQSHANALKAYFPSLLQLGSLLITHTADAASVAMGRLVLELLFEEFSSRGSDDSGGNQTAFYQGEVRDRLLALERLAGTGGGNQSADLLRLRWAIGHLGAAESLAVPHCRHEERCARHAPRARVACRVVSASQRPPVPPAHGSTVSSAAEEPTHGLPACAQAAPRRNGELHSGGSAQDLRHPLWHWRARGPGPVQHAPEAGVPPGYAVPVLRDHRCCRASEADADVLPRDGQHDSGR